jgi:hypothetical protein
MTPKLTFHFFLEIYPPNNIFFMFIILKILIFSLLTGQFEEHTKTASEGSEEK